MWDFSFFHSNKIILQVHAVHIGEEYRGGILHFQDDIAIVQLSTPLTFSDRVRAACLDLEDKDLYSRQTSPGSVGKVIILSY